MSKKVVHSLTDEDKETFDNYVRLWQERLGLHGWKFQRAVKATNKNHAANVLISYTDRLADYSIGNDFGANPVNPESLETYALHEVLHVFLCELVDQSEYNIEGDALKSAEHRVIHTLVPLLINSKGKQS